MTADWVRAADRLPAEGETVEITVMANSRDVSRAKRLGDLWSVERQFGGPYILGEPAAPAFWRPIPKKSEAA